MISPAWMATSICFLLADAKTSAGAPWTICCANWSDPAKLKVTVALPLAFPKAMAISLKASVSEAAANTVNPFAVVVAVDSADVTVAAGIAVATGAAAVAGPDGAAATGVADGREAGGGADCPPQALTNASSSMASMSRVARSLCDDPFGE